MKQICEKRQQVRINFGEWEDVSLFPSMAYGEPQAEWIWYVTFEELCNAVKNGEIKNAYTSCTFWKKRPCVKFSTLTRELEKTITAKNFDKVEMRIQYTPMKNYNMRQLALGLPAEDFIEYCKDRGVAVRVD